MINILNGIDRTSTALNAEQIRMDSYTRLNAFPGSLAC
jgi:hypothetical protein